MAKTKTKKVTKINLNRVILGSVLFYLGVSILVRIFSFFGSKIEPFNDALLNTDKGVILISPQAYYQSSMEAFTKGQLSVVLILVFIVIFFAFLIIDEYIIAHKEKTVREALVYGFLFAAFFAIVDYLWANVQSLVYSLTRDSWSAPNFFSPLSDYLGFGILIVLVFVMPLLIIFTRKIEKKLKSLGV